MKSKGCKHNASTQVIIGAFAIGLGMLFLLDNFDIFDFHRAIHFWPTVFIAIGLIKLYDTRTPAGMLVGGGFLAAGTLMLLDRLGYIDFSMRQMWPLFLIGAGAFVIVKAVSRRTHPQDGPGAAEGGDSVVDVTAILGAFERRLTSQDFRGGEITAIMGGCDLDMRDASINGEAVLNVFAVFGGISIKVPRDWTVILHGTPLLGGFEEKTTPPLDGSKRLIVKGYAIMGGVDVRN